MAREKGGERQKLKGMNGPEATAATEVDWGRSVRVLRNTSRTGTGVRQFSEWVWYLDLVCVMQTEYFVREHQRELRTEGLP